ncbi:hypothetical protein BVX97_05945 [bacterium E08(2017)]|nr:hypothetical protein BVX97_05945 [bacterium E08(2017)]
MEISPAKPYLVIVGILAAASCILLLLGDSSKLEPNDFINSLPDDPGTYSTHNAHYCQSLDCRHIWISEAKHNPACEVCGGNTEFISPLEKQALPSDTIIERKQYTSADGIPLATTLVIAGRERTSIHRPQMCLIGQGFHITRQSTMQVDIDGREIPLTVTILDIATNDKRHTGYFAYWFISAKHETHLHWTRMLLTAKDNIFRGIMPCWAYVSVMSIRQKDGPELTKDRIAEIISTLYPLMKKNNP